MDADVKEKAAENSGMEITTKALTINRIEEAVLVLGHPRSGTSATCQLVETDPDVNFMLNTEPDPSNPYGYYEHREFNALCHKWIADDPLEWYPEDTGEFLEGMRALENCTPALKMLYCPAWYYMKNFVENLKVVGVFRNPAESAKSIYRQRLFSFPIGWTQQNKTMLAAYEYSRDSVGEDDKEYDDENHMALVEFHRLLTEPEKVAKMVSESLDMDLDPSVIDKTQRSVKETKLPVTEDEKATYEALRELEQAQYE